MQSWQRSKELWEFVAYCIRYVSCSALISLFPAVPRSVHLPLTFASLHLWNFLADLESALDPVVFLFNSTGEGLEWIKIGWKVVVSTGFTACCFCKYRTFSTRNMKQFLKWLALNPVTESDNFYLISRNHGYRLRFVFIHFYNIASRFYEVSSVSSVSSVTQASETVCF